MRGKRRGIGKRFGKDSLPLSLKSSIIYSRDKLTIYTTLYDPFKTSPLTLVFYYQNLSPLVTTNLNLLKS